MKVNKFWVYLGLMLVVLSSQGSAFFGEGNRLFINNVLPGLTKLQGDKLYAPINYTSNGTININNTYNYFNITNIYNITNTTVFNNTYINITNNYNISGDGIPMGAISDSNKYSLFLNGILVMKVNSTGTFIKGDIHTNQVIDTNKSNTFSFYVNGTAYAQINLTGDLVIRSDIFTNEVLS